MPYGYQIQVSFQRHTYPLFFELAAVVVIIIWVLTIIWYLSVSISHSYQQFISPTARSWSCSGYDFLWLWSAKETRSSFVGFSNRVGSYQLLGRSPRVWEYSMVKVLGVQPSAQPVVLVTSAATTPDHDERISVRFHRVTYRWASARKT